MGRSQEFDTAAAVAAALDVFWARGYEGASLCDLEGATGLSRSSLYNSFTNKRGLFDAAVQMYLDHVIRPRLRLLTADPTPDAVDRYLASLVQAIGTMTADSPRRGCLLLNTAAGLGAHDEAVAEAIRNYRQELSDAIETGLRAAFPTASSATLQDRARILLSCTVSALVFARIDTVQATTVLESARRLNSDWQR